LTPAFLGGADGQAELRTAPFKAALRYWWRVLYGNQYDTPEKLKKAEDILFGSTDVSSKVRIEIHGEIQPQTSGFSTGKRIQVTSKGKTFPINILDYLAYGLYDYVKGQGIVYSRSHLPVKKQFQCAIYTPTDSYKEILACANALWIFGGVGSRSRNGFGSLFVTKGWEVGDYTIDLARSCSFEYPTLNKQSKLFVTNKAFPAWEDALSEIGDIYRNARNSLENRHKFERRGFVARPIEVRNENIPLNIKKGRHPKQFFLHVGKNKEGYYGQILSLPTIFYEQGKQKDYDRMIDDMHNSFSKSLSDKTTEIIQRLGDGQK
jgi:CRISPR-associated protein Cmr1